MRKLLVVVLLTIRWLLVPALPVLGLFLGLWLKPGMKPRWERAVGSLTKCAGMLEDGQNTCLLTYGQRYYENEIQTHQMVAGLSLENGEELFTRKIPARSHENSPPFGELFSWLGIMDVLRNFSKDEGRVCFS